MASDASGRTMQTGDALVCDGDDPPCGQGLVSGLVGGREFLAIAHGKWPSGASAMEIPSFHNQ